MAFQVVALENELWDGEMRRVHARGRAIVLVRVGATISAFEDRCVHLGVAISAGRLLAGTITCSAHHWQYDAATGQGVNPASAALRRFPVRVEAGRVLVDVDASEEPS